jgi:hypothetical protein
MAVTPIVLLTYSFKGETGTIMCDLKYDGDQPFAQALPPLPGMPVFPSGKVPLRADKLTLVDAGVGGGPPQYYHEGTVLLSE